MHMKKKLIRFLFVALWGTLFHFVYRWSGENTFVGFISLVNESVWEHLKLLFYPFLLLTIYDYFRFPEKRNQLVPARTVALLTAMLFLVTCFYTVWGVFGSLIKWFNIALYYITVLVCMFLEHRLTRCEKLPHLPACLIALGMLLVLFVTMTYNAPDRGIFYDVSKHPK